MFRSRYNLKRRVTSLPPITSEIFTEKVIQAQASSNAEATKAAYEKTCTVCVRTYFSENAYKNHLGSQKHRTKLAEATHKRGDDESESVVSSTFSLGEPVGGRDESDEETDSEVEEEFNEVVEGIKKTNLQDQPLANRRPSRPHNSDTPEDDAGGSVTTASSVTATGEQEVSLRRCLFCNLASPSIPANAHHMEKIHGMFIPERDYLVDLDGLIGFLHEKIYEDHECLYCGKLKPSVFGLQTHMRDLGHCKIPFDTEDQQLEIGDFYDFTSTYSDVEDDLGSEEGQQNGGVKVGAKRHAKKTDDDEDEDMEAGDGWETDSSVSTADSTELEGRPSKSHTAAYYSDYELHLPTGRTAGHRSLNRYFRQNLHSHPSPAERQAQLAIEAEGSDGSEEDQQVVVQGERGRAVAARSSAGMVGVTTEKRKQVDIAEKKSRKAEERERRKYQWGNNKQSNMQKHFRVSCYFLEYIDAILTTSRTLYCNRLQKVLLACSSF
jgi:pre-60S factor REI1